MLNKDTCWCFTDLMKALRQETSQKPLSVSTQDNASLKERGFRRDVARTLALLHYTTALFLSLSQEKKGNFLRGDSFLHFI